jgi:hypothetical protein
MDERQEGRGELIAARGDAPKLLDAAEETLDQDAALVEMHRPRPLLIPRQLPLHPDYRQRPGCYYLPSSVNSPCYAIDCRKVIGRYPVLHAPI